MIYSFTVLLGASQGVQKPVENIEQKSTARPPLPNIPMTVVPDTSVQAGGMISTDQCPFAPGDNVRVELDVEIFKMMQEGHGEYDQLLVDVSCQNICYLMNDIADFCLSLGSDL